MNNKVDLIIDSLAKGGAERVCVNFANYLNENGFIVRIILFRDEKESYINELAPNVKVLNVECNSSFYLPSKIHFNKISIYDNVICFNHQIAIAMLIYKKLFFKKFLLISRNVNYLSQDMSYKKYGIKSILTKKLVKYIYRNMDLFIAQCEEMKKDMLSFININPDRIKVIYNPVSVNIKKINDVDKIYDILFVGRLTPQKGIEYLYEILSEVVKKKPNVKICIIGKSRTEYSEHYLKKIKSLNNNEQTCVKYIDSTDDVNYFYNASRVTILTSIYEGFPNVLKESITAGTPVISFDCKSGPSEIVNSGNGILVNQFDINYFVDSIIYLLNEPIKIDSNNDNDVEFRKLVLMLNGNSCDNK